MATKEFYQKILRNPLQDLLILLAAFFLTFIIMILLFVNPDIFYFYMDSNWANGTGRALIPSAWGWISIVILIASLIAAVFIDRLEIKIWKIDLTWIFMAVAGVFLQLVLNGIYVKIIW